MFANAPARDTLAPLILRLALAAIFIYHGLGKITHKENDLGAAWATTLWRDAGKPPESVLAKLNKLPGETPEKVAEVQEKLKAIYLKDQTEMPPALQFTAAQFAVAWGELLGGIALLFGFLTRLAALGLVVIQMGAIDTVTGARGFSFAEGGGYEYNIALLAMCVALLFLGGGTLAVDRWRTRRPHAVAERPELAVR